MLGYLILALFAVAVVAYLFYPPFSAWVKGWKTLATTGGLGVLGTLQYFNWTDIFSDKKTVGLIVLGIAVTFALLRAASSGPVGQS